MVDWSLTDLMINENMHFFLLHVLFSGLHLGIQLFFLIQCFWQDDQAVSQGDVKNLVWFSSH